MEEEKWRFQNLPLSDDFMFGEVMRREHICRMFLESLLGVKIGRIEYITKEQELSDSAAGHGIRLDVYLRDEKNTLYNVEMQTSRFTEISRRVRYYQGMIDRHNLEKNEHYAKLPESYIIFVCTKDLFGRGLAVYEREIRIRDCPKATYDDGSHVYFLNSKYREGNADAAVLEFLRCIRENDIRAERYETPLMKAVCTAMADVRSDTRMEAVEMTLEQKLIDVRYEGRQEGLEEGLEEGQRKEFQLVLRNLHRKGFSTEVIAEVTCRTEEEILDALAKMELTPPESATPAP